MYPYPEIDWDALRKFRSEAVKGVMAEADVDALVLTGHDNIRYATDFGGFLICESFDWYAAIITREGEAYLFIPYVDKVIQDPLPDSPWIREYIPTPSWISSITQEEIWVKRLSRNPVALKATKVGVQYKKGPGSITLLAAPLTSNRPWVLMESERYGKKAERRKQREKRASNGRSRSFASQERKPNSLRLKAGSMTLSQPGASPVTLSSSKTRIHRCI